MRLRFKYLENGVQKYFEIRPRETGISIPIANVGSHYRIETQNDIKIVSRDTFYGNYDRLSTFGSDIRAIGVRSLFQNPWYLRVNNMIYDHTVNIDDATVTDGQKMYFDSGTGYMYFNAFIRTEYIDGSPVSVFYMGAVWGVNNGTIGDGGVCRGANGIYTTDENTIPRIDFALINITDNSDNYPCILVTVVRDSSDSNNLCYIFDMKLFDGTAPAPTTDSNTTTPYGRTGTYNFSSDKMEDAAPTGYTLVNRWEHGLTLYYINDKQVNAIFSEMWGNETLWQMFLNSTVKQIQGIICLHKVPVPVSAGTKQRALSIFGKRVARGELLEALNLVNDQLVRYPESPQWVPLEEIYGDFYDFAGQSELSVYLPFIGTIPIDVNAVMGGAIKTVYYIDLLTGNCIARVYGRNGMGNGAEVLLYQGSGNCALHVPFVGNDQGGMKMLGSLAGVATAGIAALATGGAAAAPALAAATGAAQTVLAPHNATVNNIPTECSPLSYPQVTYIQKYPERVLTALQVQQQGYAAASGGAGTTVSDYSGYLQGLLHADISGATDREKDMIEAAFERGVVV